MQVLAIGLIIIMMVLTAFAVVCTMFSSAISRKEEEQLRVRDRQHWTNQE